MATQKKKYEIRYLTVDTYEDKTVQLTETELANFWHDKPYSNIISINSPL
jgi:hypothetical protein